MDTVGQEEMWWGFETGRDVMMEWATSLSSRSRVIDPSYVKLQTKWKQQDVDVFQAGQVFSH